LFMERFHIICAGKCSINFNWSHKYNPVDLNQVSVEVEQVVHFYLYTDQDTFNSGACGQQD
jgi:hypothetical protein